MNNTIACLILFIFVLFGDASSAFASQKQISYSIDQLDIDSISVPNNLCIITRNSHKNCSSILKKIGIRVEDAQNSLTETSAYLSIISNNYEIILRMLTDSSSFKVWNLNKFSILHENDFLKLSDALQNLFKSKGIDVIKTNNYKNNNILWMVIDAVAGIKNTHAYYRQYVTIVNGRQIHVIAYSFGGDVSLNTKSLLKDIVDSIVFDQKSPPTNRVNALTAPIKPDAQNRAVDGASSGLIKGMFWGLLLGFVGFVYRRFKKSAQKVQQSEDEKKIDKDI